MYDKIKKVNWIDSILNEIKIEFNKIIINILLESEESISIICNEFVSIKYLGQWDESIINSIEVSSNSEFIKESLEVVRSNYAETEIIGCNKHLNNEWLQVTIKLIDGVDINIVCNSIEIT
ncbi:hypothetical protein [Clostridium sartagoforme]|uniref:hypothetical protein n=1 Tax=Clostridium sartagoforme TaxID=84031 RepID=UPI0031D68433